MLILVRLNLFVTALKERLRASIVHAILLRDLVEMLSCKEARERRRQEWSKNIDPSIARDVLDRSPRVCRTGIIIEAIVSRHHPDPVAKNKRRVLQATMIGKDGRRYESEIHHEWLEEVGESATVRTKVVLADNQPNCIEEEGHEELTCDQIELQARRCAASRLLNAIVDGKGWADVDSWHWCLAEAVGVPGFDAHRQPREEEACEDANDLRDKYNPKRLAADRPSTVVHK